MKCPPTTTKPSPSKYRLPQHLPLTSTASSTIAGARRARRHSQHTWCGLPRMPPHRPFRARGRPHLRVAPWKRVRMLLCMHLQRCVRALLKRDATRKGRMRRALTSAGRRKSGQGRTSGHDRIARSAMQRASLPSVWPLRTGAPQQRMGNIPDAPVGGPPLGRRGSSDAPTPAGADDECEPMHLAAFAGGCGGGPQGQEGRHSGPLSPPLGLLRACGLHGEMMSSR